MILIVGEILFDLFPDQERLGGAPFNFAYHLKMLGHDVRFVSRVGRDDRGERIFDFLEVHGFDIRDIQQDPVHPTGTVQIIMNPDKSHDFHIAENTAYDHLDWNRRLQELAGQKWALFYYGSLIQRKAQNAGVIQQVLSAKSPSALRFCDINLRKGCYSKRSIEACMGSTDILKLNREELQSINLHDHKKKSESRVAYKLMETYNVSQIILTCGADGSTWYGPGKNRVISPPAASAAIKDSVGAGDAFAAVSAAGILRKLPVPRILSLASQFALKVCETKGAIPDDKDLYRYYKRRLEG